MTRSLRIAAQMDRIDDVKIDADSTFAMMLAAQARGHTLWHYDYRSLELHDDARGIGVACTARPVTVRHETGNHHTSGAPQHLDLAHDIDVVLMRQDPPFDMAYITATHILDHIHPKTLVVNDPTSVRNAPEKLLVTQFPDLMPPTLVTWDVAAMRAFREEHGEIIVKPLFGNGGAGVFRLGPKDENFNSLLEMHFARSREPLMLQRYEPAVRRGDKRIILIDGHAAGAVNRIPAVGESRSNLHVGGKAAASTLTARERDICARIGPTLREQGMIFVGIDVIGDWLTEINVTSPTGIQEIGRFDGTDLATDLIVAIENKVADIARTLAKPLG